MQIKFKAISRPWRYCYDEPRVVHCVSHWLKIYEQELAFKIRITSIRIIDLQAKTGVKPTSASNGE